MKVQIISDLHIDINKEYKTLNNADLTLIAGDIANSAEQELKYLNSLNLDGPVIAVPGNHLGYNYGPLNDFNDVTYEGTLQQQIEYIQTHIKNNIYYINNDTTVYNKGFTIYGGCMYTNFSLNNTPELSKRIASKYINDFTNVKIRDNEIRTVTCDDYINWFNLFIKNLEKVLKEGNPTIVVTHFCPSPKSIHDKFKNSPLNPYYCINLEDFIKEHKNIKLWVHGHTHCSFDYWVGQCRVICSPVGYRFEDEYNWEPTMIEV